MVGGRLLSFTLVLMLIETLSFLFTNIRALNRPRSRSVPSRNPPSSPHLTSKPRFTSPAWARTCCRLVWAQGLCGVLRTVLLRSLYLLSSAAPHFPKALNAALTVHVAKVRFSPTANWEMVEIQLLRTAGVQCLAGTLRLRPARVPAESKSTTVTQNSISHLRRVWHLWWDPLPVGLRVQFFQKTLEKYQQPAEVQDPLAALKEKPSSSEVEVLCLTGLKDSHGLAWTCRNTPWKRRERFNFAGGHKVSVDKRSKCLVWARICQTRRHTDP